MGEKIVSRRDFLLREAPDAAFKTWVLSRAISSVVLGKGISFMRPASVAAQEFSEINQEKWYFPDTGHHLSGDFLNFWRINRNGYVFGKPISEPFRNEIGKLVQYFENVRMEQGWWGREVHLGLLGAEYFIRNRFHYSESETDVFFDRFAAKYPANLGRLIETEDSLFMHAQAKIIHTGIASFYKAYPGAVAPEAAMDWLIGRDREQAMSFNILWAEQILPRPLGRIMAKYNLIDEAVVEPHSDAVLYYPDMFDAAKRIEVNLENQTLTAYEKDLVIMETFVSTGKRGYPTPVGKFEVYEKEPLMDYEGWEGTRPYLQPAVPHNLKFYPETLIHGAYWHNKFGIERVSMGCVNLEPYDAAWLYNWARLGTPVKIA